MSTHVFIELRVPCEKKYMLRKVIGNEKKHKINTTKEILVVITELRNVEIKIKTRHPSNELAFIVISENILIFIMFLIFKF